MSIPVWFRAVVSRCWWAGGVVAGGLMCAARLVAAPADYLVDVLDTKDNLPSSTVTAITQTPEGYLWIGTYNGLTRFDGVRFVTFDPSNTPELEHSRVQGLFLDVGGTLWINTYRGGLTSFRDGVFRRERPGQAGFDLHTTLAWSGSNKVVFAEQFGEVLVRTQTGTNVSWTVYPPPAGARPFYQCAAPDGTLWYVRREGTLMRFAGNQFQELPPEAGVGTNRAHVVAMDAQGRAWVGADNFLGRWDGRVFEPQLPADTGPAFNPTRVVPTRSGAVWVLANDRLRKWSDGQWTAEVKAWQGLLSWAGGRVTGVHEDANGGVWFNHYGNGVFHITPEGEFQRLTTQDGLPGDRVGAWFQSSDGGVWLGVDRGGLARLRERRFQLIDTAQGLTVRTVLSVCEDGSGDLWIGTGGGGLYRWSDEKLSSYALGPSVAANFVFSIYPQPGGGVWLSATETENLFRLRGNRLERAPWDPRGVKSILVDQTGRVWLGTKSGLAWWSEQGRRIFGANDGLSPLDGAGDSPVRALTQSPEGVVWCGSDDGALYRCETERLQAYRPRDAVGDKPIWSLLADREGAIWAGTFRGGLLRFQKGEFKRITAAQGLPEDTIVQI
ncbi:MAG: two-component regulator propeller domain-containing protein, partial [Verrucomicrobiota bacterium]